MGTSYVADVKYDAEKGIVEILSKDGERLSEGQLALLIDESCKPGKGSFKGRILVYTCPDASGKKPEH